jgi:hypothetical protein
MNNDCAIRMDGTLACWRANNASNAHGYTGPQWPAQGTFKRIAVGPNTDCAIRSDDSIVCWDPFGNLFAPPDFYMPLFP